MDNPTNITAKLHAMTTMAMRCATHAAREVRSWVQKGARTAYGDSIDFKGTSFPPVPLRLKRAPVRGFSGFFIPLMGAFVVLFLTSFSIHASPKIEDWLPGAARFERYVPQLQGARVAVVAHAASVVPQGDQWVHTVDALRDRGIRVVKVFAPEHGFRSTASAGELVPNGKDEKTGLPLVSLYGNHKKPTAADLKDVDVVVFDLQDVGARFYTYISTLTYVMEACAAYGKPLVVLDRPNPNGDRLDGPVLDTTSYKSFVGMHAVPVLYGMTIGEYAGMVHGEGWAQTRGLQLSVVPLDRYHRQPVALPVPPSPNLRTPEALHAYPSLCFFEGTPVSVGRGTDRPFEQYGAPWYPKKFGHRFVPLSKPGATDPLYRGDTCYGYKYAPTKRPARDPLDWEPLVEMYRGFVAQSKQDDAAQSRVDAYLLRRKLRQAYDSALATVDTNGFRLMDTASVIFAQTAEVDSTQFYRKPRISRADRKSGFVRPFMNRLVGTADVAQALAQELPTERWPALWEEDLRRFEAVRRLYLLYSDGRLYPAYETYEPPRTRK